MELFLTFMWFIIHSMLAFGLALVVEQFSDTSSLVIFLIYFSSLTFLTKYTLTLMLINIKNDPEGYIRHIKEKLKEDKDDK